MEGLLTPYDKWLAQNNLLSDHMKDNIAMGGYCLVEEVLDSSTSIDFNNKVVTYGLLLPKKLHKKLMILERFQKGESIGFFEGLILKRFIKIKRQNDDSGMGYDLERIGNEFIKAYLTPEWSVNVDLFKDDEDGRKSFLLHSQGNQQSN